MNNVFIPQWLNYEISESFVWNKKKPQVFIILLLFILLYVPIYIVPIIVFYTYIATFITLNVLINIYRVYVKC